MRGMMAAADPCSHDDDTDFGNASILSLAHLGASVQPMAASTLPSTLGATERLVLADFAAFLRQRFGARLRDVRLFGSRARGEGHEGSDLDVLAVVDDLTHRERREVWDRTGDVMTQDDVIVGGMTLSTAAWQDLQARELRIVGEIERDGIAL
jgi:hypothetical protein